ncbi:hypothetical protein SB757_28085, partial [Pseudomonas sp. SIMBA_065]
EALRFHGELAYGEMLGHTNYLYLDIGREEMLVVEERENIAPGLSQVINANLLPGDYAITCGLLSNPRGTLHVTPTAESDAQAKAKPSMVAFIGPLSEFRV